MVNTCFSVGQSIMSSAVTVVVTPGGVAWGPGAFVNSAQIAPAIQRLAAESEG